MYHFHCSRTNDSGWKGQRSERTRQDLGEELKRGYEDSWKGQRSERTREDLGEELKRGYEDSWKGQRSERTREDLGEELKRGSERTREDLGEKLKRGSERTREDLGEKLKRGSLIILSSTAQDVEARSKAVFQSDTGLVAACLTQGVLSKIFNGKKNHRLKVLYHGMEKLNLKDESSASNPKGATLMVDCPARGISHTEIDENIQDARTLIEHVLKQFFWLLDLHFHEMVGVSAMDVTPLPGLETLVPAIPRYESLTKRAMGDSPRGCHTAREVPSYNRPRLPRLALHFGFAQNKAGCFVGSQYNLQGNSRDCGHERLPELRLFGGYAQKNSSQLPLVSARPSHYAQW
ncbi:hypothetical protein IWZ03DRAFT_359422 [Phyllosticta citriasiana]|uniref:Uncharacterized protein n=1 Tax=Phyllosticta citriasiana TaxID=595635 RepID=A0ABR1KLB4_9PEZI